MTLCSSPDSSTPDDMNSKTTATHASVQNLDDSSEDVITSNTLSGVEELPLTQNYTPVK